MNESFGFGDSITAEDFYKKFYKSSDNNNKDEKDKSDFSFLILALLFVLFSPGSSRDASYWKGKYDALKELYTDDGRSKNV